MNEERLATRDTCVGFPRGVPGLFDRPDDPVDPCEEARETKPYSRRSRDKRSASPRATKSIQRARRPRPRSYVVIACRGAPRRLTPPAGPFDRPGALAGDVGRLDEAYFRTSPRAASGSRAPGRGPSKLPGVYVFGDAARSLAGRVGHTRPSKIRFGPNFNERRGDRVAPPPRLSPGLGRARGFNEHGSTRPGRS